EGCRGEVEWARAEEERVPRDRNRHRISERVEDDGFPEGAVAHLLEEGGIRGERSRDVAARVAHEVDERAPHRIVTNENGRRIAFLRIEPLAKEPAVAVALLDHREPIPNRAARARRLAWRRSKERRCHASTATRAVDVDRSVGVPREARDVLAAVDDAHGPPERVVVDPASAVRDE